MDCMKLTTRFLVFVVATSACYDERTQQASSAEAKMAGSVQVDQLLSEEIFTQHPTMPLAPRTDDITYVRRVWLDLLGHVPSPEETIEFVLSQDPAKREKLVERLLQDPRFDRNWGRYWRDVILYRRTEERAIAMRGVLTEYFANHFRDNTPWDQVAREFVTATGEVRDNGNAAIIVAQSGEPENTAAEVARIFMGIQIQCAQCHDHPFDRWKRQQFHELAAFFPRVAVRRTRMMGERGFQVVSNDQAPRRQQKANRRVRGTLEHYMPDLENPTARGQLIQPALFTTGQKLDIGVPDEERRDKLASWVTSSENEWFSKSLVNRLWSELVGEGFVEPIDNLGPDREPQAPRTFDFLSAEFVRNGYDIQWLFRTILATETYQRDSRPRRAPDGPPFTANRPQPLRSDQLFDVFLQVVQEDQPRQQSALRKNMLRSGPDGPRLLFQNTFGYDPSQLRSEVAASIPQALALMNSPQVNRAIQGGKPWGLGKWLRELDDDGVLVNELYLRCLAREPTATEIKTCLAYVEETDNRRRAFEDILWSLINSVEFRYRV